jgi:hypothetical protein
MNNKKLQEKYEDVYKQGKEEFFTRFVNEKDINRQEKIKWLN